MKKVPSLGVGKKKKPDSGMLALVEQKKKQRQHVAQAAPPPPFALPREGKGTGFSHNIRSIFLPPVFTCFFLVVLLKRRGPQSGSSQRPFPGQANFSASVLPPPAPC